MFSKNKNLKVINSKIQKEIDDLMNLINSNNYISPNWLKNINRISLSLSSSKLSGTSSNAIEGIVVSTNQKRSLNINAKALIENYNLILNYIKDFTPEIKLDKNTILSWHNQLFRNTFQAESIGGKFKNTVNKVIDNKGNVLMVGSEPWETPLLIDELCDWYEKSDLNVLIKIPIFIFDFLSIHPFNDGNGRMSRLLTNFLLMKEGFAFVRYESFEQMILENQDEYLISLSKCNKGWNQHQNDYSPFIEFNLQILESIFNKFINYLKFTEELYESKLNKRRQSILIIEFLLDERKSINKKDILDFISSYSIEISERTIENVLAFLLSNNFLKFEGKTKGIKYFDLNTTNIEDIIEMLK